MEKTFFYLRLKQFLFLKFKFSYYYYYYYISGRRDVSTPAGERASRRGHGTGVLMNNWRGRRKMEAAEGF